jgi:hypothetical protein
MNFDFRNWSYKYADPGQSWISSNSRASRSGGLFKMKLFLILTLCAVLSFAVGGGSHIGWRGKQNNP